MSKFSKKQSENTWKKYLAQAITAGLLTGMYNTAGFAAAPLFTDAITGDQKADTAYSDYVNSFGEEGNYYFVNGATINMGAKGQAAIDQVSSNGKLFDVTIRSIGDMTLNVGANGAENRYGVRHIINAADGWSANGLMLQSKKLNINVNSDLRAEGIHTEVDGAGSIPVEHTFSSVDQTPKANVILDINGKQGAAGIYTGGGTSVKILGALTMNVDGGSQVTDFKTVGIHVDSARNNASSAVTVNNKVDITTNGTGILAEGNKAKVELREDANINIKKDDKNVNYSLAANGGNITLNYDKVVNGHEPNYANPDKAVVLNGNIGLLGNGGSIIANLYGEKSVFNGVVFNKEGATDGLNMTLANGAVWNNEAYGATDASFKGSVVENFVGGSSDSNAGVIHQKDTHALTFNNYSGNSFVIYEHTGDGTHAGDYAAGNVIIKKANFIGKDNNKSTITLSTNNTGIDMQDTSAVDKALDALAGKLFYEGIVGDVDGEAASKLEGRVQIASGLTASGALRQEKITFDSATGQGNYGSTQTIVDFTKNITGDEATDKVYVDAGVLKNGQYIFDKDSTITLTDGTSAIDVKKAVNITSEKKLTLNTSGTAKAGSIIGVQQNGALNSNINVGSLDINVQNAAGRAEGIVVNNTTAGERAQLNVKGNVNINTSGSGNSIGIHTSGNSELTITGDVAVNNTVTSANDARYGYYENGAIYAGGNKDLQKGSIININGNVDLKGNGVMANGNGSTVNINGGGNISVDKNAGKGAFALAAQSGTINVNMNKEHNGAADNTLVIDGNIGLTSGVSAMGETAKESVINVGLSNEQSALHGVIANVVPENQDGFVGEANLYLSNGATWNNEQYGELPVQIAGQFTGSHLNTLAGGSDAAHRGVILQNDTNAIKVDNYSGHNMVIYEHTGNGTQADHYAAGDFIIDKAAQGSGIVLSTDSSNINMQDSNEVSAVLNALANKLYYKDFVNGVANLDGKVQIASGLTSSSQAMRVKDITFDSATGQGSYQKPDGSVNQEHKVQIAEDNIFGDIQRKYWRGQYVLNGERNYIFDTNTTLNVSASDDPDAHQHGYGAIQWAGTGNGSIDMTGHKLSIITDGQGSIVNKDRPHGIVVESETLNINNVKGLDILVKNSNTSNGIFVIGMPSAGAWDNGAGNAHLIINNGDELSDAVKIRFENSTKINAGIYLKKNSGTAALDIAGLVDVEVGNGGRGIYNDRGTANIGGGRIVAHEDYAVYTGGGTTTINAKLDENGVIKATSDTRDVVIDGDIYVSDDISQGSMNLALNTAGSSLKGVINNNGTGEANVLLANKAQWTNEMVHNIDGWQGSHVAQLVGGKNASSAGYIMQKDSKDLTVDKYSGNVVVVYEHQNDGSKATDYAAGNTVINSASQNSGIVLSTDSSNIDMGNSDLVNKVLDSLAGKLFYKNFVTGENNLEGKVQIASGLTASSAAKVVGNIAFDKQTGQGSYTPENKLTFTAPITGDYGTDKAYVDKGIMQPDGVYNFAAGSNITVKGNADENAAVDIAQGAENVVINANNSTLNLENDKIALGGRVSGYKSSVVGKAEINAKELNIKIKDADSGTAIGIFLEGKSRNGATELVINGNTNINAHASQGNKAQGIFATIDSKLTINGNVTMRGDADNKWGVNDDGIDSSYSQSPNIDSVGILAQTGHNGNYESKGSKITVNGDVDLAIDGTGIAAKGQDSSVTINGGGNIEINKDGQKGSYAVLAIDGGKVDINTGDTVDKELVIKGNLGVFAEPYTPAKETVLNIGLKGEDSSLTGLAHNGFAEKDKAKGQINMNLSDNAVWKNEAYGELFAGDAYDSILFNGSEINNFVGGSDASHAGIIEQNDSHKLTINNYSGNALVFYEHTGDGTNAKDYAAGDTIIKNAAKDSAITLSTGNNGINMNDDKAVANVLNTLAGKLTYEAFVSGEKNLNGKVQIASGLTSSSASAKVGDITFNEQGQGTYVPPKEPEIPEHQNKVEFSQIITGDKKLDKEYLYSGVLKENGTYVFEKDSDITITDAKNAAINVKKDVIINATGSTLNLHTQNMGIKQETDKKAEITADRLNINVENKGRVEGIHLFGVNKKAEVTINGNTNITAHGVDYTLGAYAAGDALLTFNGNVTMKGENGAWGIDNNDTSANGYYSISGLYAGSDNKTAGATINVNGNVDLAVNGTGVLANGFGSTVNINGGGTIVTNKDASDFHYGLAATNGTVNMNMNDAKDGAANNKVNIQGNLGVTDGAAHENDPVKDSVINLGLSTQDSTLEGVIVKDFKESNIAKGYTGEVNLYLSNGATWNNSVYGSVSLDFAGSEVEKLVGGSDEAHRGVILQNDENKLTVNNYSGNTLIIYDHTGDGSKAEDYAAGDTIIKQAEKGSAITLSTSNNGINMKDSASIEATLNALAGKLTYEGAIGGVANNLTGKVQIASGLTASSAQQQVGDINFNETTGKGDYVEGSMKPGVQKPEPQPGPNPNPDKPDYEQGDYETNIMAGTRAAMTDSMLYWRENAADSFVRTQEMRNGAEEGAWARIYGGSTKYEGNKTDIDSNYYAVQGGFDKEMGDGWTAGMMFDYRDGDGSYTNGAEGEHKMYSLGVYGSKKLADKAYIDLAAKFGTVENDITARNEIGQEIKGEYSADSYSLSAQYGKRFEKGNGYFEPQVQLTWAHVDGSDFAASNSKLGTLNVQQDAFDSLVGRIGIEAGQEGEHGKYFARLSLNHEFAGDVNSTYSAADGGAKSTTYDVAGTWSELTVGGNYKLSQCANFYADVTKALTGDYKQDWKVNAGFSFSF